jgi:predicted TIM-barrel fold metal-dependent hydrolase
MVLMIIDSHVHMYIRDMQPDSIVEAYLAPLKALEAIMDMGVEEEFIWPEFRADDKELIKGMDMAGIDKSIILPLDHGLVEKPKIDFEEMNQWVFERSEVYPDRLIPFVGIDPNRGARAIKFVEECVSKWDAKGVKVYPANGFYPQDEDIDDFWTAMEDMELVVVTHSGAAWGPLKEEYCHPSFFGAVLERHPSLKIVIAHLGGKWREESYDLLERYDNAFADCSALQGWLPSQPDMAISRLKEVAEKAPDKVFFGSDWPVFELSYTIKQWVEFVVESDWADDGVKEKLMHLNIRKILDI